MLELKNISFTLPDGKEILKDISFSIPKGELVVITGPNGSGKTTLAKILAGVENPTSGQILLNGEDITQVNITDKAKMGIAYGFQQPVRFKGITVKDLLEMSTGRKLSFAEGCTFINDAGLCTRDYINREVDNSLSGGEIKRIEIITVLARDAQIYVFDEPEAGIDLWSFGNLIKVFEKKKENLDGIIIIISHQERILEIADRIALLKDGKIESFEKREPMLEHIYHESCCCELGSKGCAMNG